MFKRTKKQNIHQKHLIPLIVAPRQIPPPLSLILSAMTTVTRQLTRYVRRPRVAEKQVRNNLLVIINNMRPFNGILVIDKLFKASGFVFRRGRVRLSRCKEAAHPSNVVLERPPGNKLCGFLTDSMGSVPSTNSAF